MQRSFLALVLGIGIAVANGGSRAQEMDGQPSANAQFDVVSIKPDKPEKLGDIHWCLPPDGMRCRQTGIWSMAGMPVAILIANAYEVDANKISGGDSWVKSLTLTVSIEVKPGVSDQQFGLMMQNMLADRFKLRGHLQQREESVAVLQVAKGSTPPTARKNCTVGEVAGPSGPGQAVPCGGMVEFWTVTPPDAGSGSRDWGKRELIARSVTMDDFVASLGPRHSFFPIVNETHLPGKYDLDVSFDAMQNPFSDETQMALAVALRKQAGLAISFRPIKRLRPEYVIDHIEKPTPN